MKTEAETVEGRPDAPATRALAAEMGGWDCKSTEREQPEEWELRKLEKDAQPYREKYRKIAAQMAVGKG